MSIATSVSQQCFLGMILEFIILTITTARSKLITVDNLWECQIGGSTEVYVSSEDFGKFKTIEWRRGGVSITPNHKHFNITTDPNGSRLTIQRVVSVDFEIKKWVFAGIESNGRETTHDFGPIRQLPSVEGFIIDNNPTVIRDSIDKRAMSPLKVQCKISVPVIEKNKVLISWLFRQEGADDYIPIFENLTTTSYVNDTLNFDSLSRENRGHYDCQMQYETLNSSIVAFLRVKNKYAALWPFLISLLEIVVLALLVFRSDRRETLDADLTSESAKESLVKKN
ncbi:hypothetical protein ACOME3_004867 [Neoechinorhynchus agilis]